jgi:hypothetical protein
MNSSGRSPGGGSDAKQYLSEAASLIIDRAYALGANASLSTPMDVDERLSTLYR